MADIYAWIFIFSPSPNNLCFCCAVTRKLEHSMSSSSLIYIRSRAFICLLKCLACRDANSNIHWLSLLCVSTILSFGHYLGAAATGGTIWQSALKTLSLQPPSSCKHGVGHMFQQKIRKRSKKLKTMIMPWLTQFLCTIQWISFAACRHDIVNIHDTVDIYDIVNIYDTVNICPPCKHFFTVVNTARSTCEMTKWI